MIHIVQLRLASRLGPNLCRFKHGRTVGNGTFKFVPAHTKSNKAASSNKNCNNNSGSQGNSFYKKDRISAQEANRKLVLTLKNLSTAPDLRKKTEEYELSTELIVTALPKFLRKVSDDSGLWREWLQLIFKNIDLKRTIHTAFFQFLQQNYSDRVGDQFTQLVALGDLSDPAAWWPEARRMKRKIIMHVGPTNSGKTYAALKKLGDPETQVGIYCGPLRLLAHEVVHLVTIGIRAHESIRNALQSIDWRGEERK